MPERRTAAERKGVVHISLEKVAEKEAASQKATFTGDTKRVIQPTSTLMTENYIAIRKVFLFSFFLGEIRRVKQEKCKAIGGESEKSLVRGSVDRVKGQFEVWGRIRDRIG